MNRDTLISLRDRVRAATGPDREIDRDLWAVFVAETPRANADGLRYIQPEPYTTSIDAALALVERVLPDLGGHSTDRHKCADGSWLCSADIAVKFEKDGVPYQRVAGRAERNDGHQALAVLECALTALIERSE